MKEKEEFENSSVGVIEQTEKNEKIEQEIEEKISINSLENQKDENQTTSEKSSKRKMRLILIIALILLVILLLFSTIFAIINIKNKKIIKGIQIDQIDVSNMTKEEAKSTLQEIYSKKLENEIYLTYNEFESSITYNALEVQYQIDTAVNKAYEIGRDGNLFKDNFDIIKTRLKGTQIYLDVTIDKDMIDQVVQNINNSIEGAVVQPEYYLEGDKLIINSGKEGLQADEIQLYQELYTAIQQETKSQEITIPMKTALPNAIDIEKIHQEVYKETKDAYYTKDPFTIYPEVIGIDFNIENARTILQEAKEQYNIPLIKTNPQVTVKQIGTEAFPDLLSTFSTKYNAGDANRTTNVRLAANKINGTVLLPGEEFSYNQTVGRRTKEAGFKEASVFNAGRIETGIGGGICQISTTLYDAVIMADLDVTVRRNHQFVTSYAGGGKDATVVWGAQDFKFKNTRDYPVRITATVSGGVATVQIWGLKKEVEYDITIESKKTATIPYTTQYVTVTDLAPGEQKVIQAGNNGSKYEAYKVKRLNGQVVSKTLLSKDTYNAMKKIVHVGAGQ